MKIAISGLSSVGTTSVARLLGQRLKIPTSTYTLRDLAKEMGVDFQSIHSEVKKRNTDIDYALDGKQLDFVNNNQSALIASDLALWLDDERIYQKLGRRKPSFDLKIWLEASLANRAKRFIKSGKGTKRNWKRYDQENRDHHFGLYGIDTNKHGFAWILDTNNKSLTQVVEEISERVKKSTKG